MSSLDHHDVSTLLLGLGIMLGVARLLGEIALKLKQPSVLGEILAGVILGPTVFGSLAPEWSAQLLPATGNVPLSLSALTTLAITLFLLVAGMEVDLSTVWRQGKAAIGIGTMGIVIPFGLTLAVIYAAPWLMGATEETDLRLFALFVATALSISALPVIAKTLMDLNLFRTDMGMVIVAAAILNDLVGWIIFAIILAMMGQEGGLPIHWTIGLTLGFVVFMLTIGRWLIDKTLPWIQAHGSWPGGVLGFALSLALIFAAFTEWIGVHAIFGSFIFGIALGDSRHLRERTRSTIDQFISFIFAPLFFASIGLQVNFITGFDLGLVLIVLVLATIGKLVGCGLTARWAGFSKRESWAVGIAMNSRGAMEIILGLLGLKAGLIDEKMFVALVIMALVTSMSSGALIQLCLRQRKEKHFTDYLHSKHGYCRLKARSKRDAIRELVETACKETTLQPDQVERLVWSREQIVGTSLEHGVAVPHSRLSGIEQPIVVVGISEHGIDWDSPDGEPTVVVVMLLTPRSDNEIQLDLLADVARTLRNAKRVRRAHQTSSYTEFLACIKSELRAVAGH